MKTRFLRSVSWFLLVLLVPGILNAQTPQQDNTELYKKLGGFGVALGGLLYNVGRDNIAVRNDTVTTDQFKTSLDQMIKARKENQDNAAGTLAVLNASLEVALKGTDIATGGFAFGHRRNPLGEATRLGIRSATN